MAYLSTLSAARTTGLYHPDLLSNDILQAAMLCRPSIHWTSVVCLRPSGLQHYVACLGAQRCQGVSHSHKNNKCWPFRYTNSDTLWFNICSFYRNVLISCSYMRDCALVNTMCSCRSYAVNQLIIRTKLYNTALTCLFTVEPLLSGLRLTVPLKKWLNWQIVPKHC
jgi:hypothetical protein